MLDKETEKGTKFRAHFPAVTSDYQNRKVAVATI